MIKILDFYADWCGPCRMMNPIVEELKQEHPDVEFWKIDVEANQDVAIAHNIQSIPTFLFFKDEVLVKRMTGFIPKYKIKDILQNL